MVSDSIYFIKWGTSFGECSGYCRNEVTINANKIIKVKKSYNIKDSIIYHSTTITKPQWVELKNSFDIKAFFKLPQRIGCPDCSDGGAEWIEIQCSDRIYKVTFEYGANISAIKGLLKIFRQIKEQAIAR